MQYPFYLKTGRHTDHFNSSAQGWFALVLVTLLWGSTYPIIKETLTVIPPSLVLYFRFTIAALLLIPWWPHHSTLIRWGILLGFWLFTSYATQTIGLQYTSANRCAFVHATNVIFVPLLMGLWHHHFQGLTLLMAGVAFGGVGLLVSDGIPIQIGDIWALLSGICYALYIICLDAVPKRYSPLSLTTIALTTVAILSSFWLGISSDWEILASLPNLPWLSILYLGVITTAFVITLQAWGQHRVHAEQAALIYTLEPVWAALISWALGETFGLQGILGATLILSAIMLNQIHPHFE